MKIDGFTRMVDVPEKPTEWLWDGYIPLGELTILEGHPGTNKSSLTDDLAARLTRGRAMPCLPPKRGRKRKGGALFLIGEDDPGKTVRKRLVAADADLAKIGVLDDIAIPKDGDMLRIEKAIRELDATLVVVDTINDFLACNTLANQQVRKALRPLRELAVRTSAAVVGIRHFTKNANGHSLLHGGGSVGITAVVRSQLKLYAHPDDAHLRVLVQDKNALIPVSPSLLFEVVGADNDSFRLDWRGACPFTVEDLQRRRKGSPTLEAAEKFLLEQLADGPKEVNGLVEQAKAICGKRTLDEAKRSLEVKTGRRGCGKDHKVYWSL